MTNFLPTLSVSMQAIHPSLQTAAERLTNPEFVGLAEQARDDVLHARYAELTHLLTRHGVEPAPDVVSQLCSGRHLFFGEPLPHNLWQALQRVPAIYGDEAVEGLMTLRGKREDHQIAQDLVTLCGTSFRGDFSQLLTRLQGLVPFGSRIRLNQGESCQSLSDALNLRPELARHISLVHYFVLDVPLLFFIRYLAHAVANPPLPSMTVRELRDLFFRGYHCQDESIRLSYIFLTPALCADPSVEEGVKIGGLTALRNAWQNDPSPAIRQAATYALTQMPK